MSSIIRPLSAWLFASTLAAVSYAAANDDGKIIVPMKPVSVFDIADDVSFSRGGWGSCGVERSAEVKAYPSFVSELPLFGSVSLAGEDPPTRFAIDESEGTGSGYDRMYLDRNRNLDLTDDAVLGTWDDHPEGAVPYRGEGDTVVCFERFLVPGDFGEVGELQVEVMPRLNLEVYGDKLYRSVNFVGTKAHRGELEVGGQEYVVYLGHDRSAAGRHDRPQTALFLFPKAKRSRRPYWWGGDRLNALHQLGGTLYGFAASPLGDRLTVKPYRGAFGTFAIGAGERELEKLRVRGSLRGTETAVAVGGPIEHGSPSPVASCRLPVGDYLPSYLTIDFGSLQISLSNNYHSDGEPRESGSAVYGIEIREDRPFVLDFSNEPEVLFATPAKDARLRVGETLEVKAVLVDPKLDIMIRGLDNTSRTGEESIDEGDDEVARFQEPVSLDPKVIITRADGEKVTQGNMPFG